MENSLKKKIHATKQRLQAILKGAFAGPPTPLKDIPTKSGESRQIGKKKQPSGASAASAKTASPDKRKRA
jgi:hypothetical protein